MMGYYTNYELNASEVSDDLIEEVKRMNVFYDGFTNIPVYADEMKWYSWKEDMIILSKKFPNVLFTLHGEGEEAEDLWNAYFKNGKVQVCKAQIIYPEYCESMMKELPVRRRKYSYQS